MTQNDRVKEVRKSLGFTLEKFGERIGLKKSAVSLIENGKNELTEGNAKAICREFNVNEEWLRTGNGEMHPALSEEEEVAELVSNILEEGTDNAFYKIILEIVRTYNELTPASQKVLAEVSERLAINLNKKKED